MTADLLGSVADLFSRVETRRHATSVVTGLQTQLETKNCWSLAQNAGHADPWRLQHCFNDAKWDHDAIRERVAVQAWNHLVHRSERVLVFDETGDLRKGEHTLGVQRQYTGTAGRIENAQVTVSAAWATGTERVLVDYEVYLPESWTNSHERLEQAGVPEEVGFATKIEQASAILARRLSAGQTPTAIAGDAVYGRSGPLRAQAETAGIAYVLEAGKDKQVTVHPEVEPERVDALAEAIPTRNWSNRSAGARSKGQRVYAWGYLTLDSTDCDGERGLLSRWNRRTNEYASYLTYQPGEAVSLRRLIRIAGLRWPVETCFQDTKGHFGLDEHQMRTWTSVRRWITLCLFAAAVIAIAHRIARSQGTRPSLTGLARLHAQITRPNHDDSHRYYWSEWICDHNETARQSHYHRRDDYLPS